MTLQEKLDLIDEEIRKIHIFCTKSGFSSNEVERFAQPFFERNVHEFTTSIWPSGKAWKRRIVALSTVFVLSVFLFRVDPAYQLVCAVSKTGAIQVCDTIEKVERLINVPGQKLMEEYVTRDIPAIVMGEDLVQEDLSLRKLSTMYSKNPALRRYLSCSFSTNVRQMGGDHVDLLQHAQHDGLDKFYAEWENCNLGAAKAFRGVYKRPEFLPPTISLSQTNWVFVASNYTGNIYKTVDVSHKMMVFIQARGESWIKLDPWEPCNHICTHFHELLQEGEILIVTDFLWKVGYLPTNKSEHIAIAFGADFD